MKVGVGLLGDPHLNSHSSHGNLLDHHWPGQTLSVCCEDTVEDKIITKSPLVFIEEKKDKGSK